METIETERLTLVPLTIADAPAIQRLFPRWEIVRWLNGVVPWPYPADGAETFLRDVVLPAMAAGEAWHWSIHPKDQAGGLIGVVSLMDQANDNRGFWLDPAWQGRGLMTEASNAVTDYWFDTLGKPVLRVPKAIGNPASRRISEKQAMRVVSRFRQKLVSGVQDVELWEIGAPAWRAHRVSTAS